MAEKTAPAVDPKTFAETATKAVEDTVGKAQNQYLAMLSESQNLMLDAYKSMFDGVSVGGLHGQAAGPDDRRRLRLRYRRAREPAGLRQEGVRGHAGLSRHVPPNSLSL